MFVRRTLVGRYSRIHSGRANSSLNQCPPAATSRVSSAIPSTDELGLPLSPPWSVHNLINSYPSPTLSNPTVMHLHKLAALVPPKVDTPEFRKLKQELEDLVKLVEAVKVVASGDTHKEHSPPDGRVWAHGRGVSLSQSGGGRDQCKNPPAGQALLEHAERTRNGFYLVDSTRSKT